MKHQASFSSKDKSKKLKCRLLQFLFGALRVDVETEKYEQHCLLRFLCLSIKIFFSHMISLLQVLYKVLLYCFNNDFRMS